MSVPVLVATPHEVFGELLRLSLEEDNLYQVRLARSAREALDLLKAQTFQAAILDSDLADMPLAELSRALLKAHHPLKVVIIPPDNDPNHPSLAGMIYHGYILRPFYLPDLLEQMQALTGAPTPAPADQPAPPEPSAASTAVTPPPAEPRPNRQQFERAVAASTALAGLSLNAAGTSQAAGHMSDQVADALRGLAERALKTGEHTDLVRFVRLPGRHNDYLFYVTRLDPDCVLALAYPVGTPLSRVRVQAGQIVRAMQAPATVEAGPPPAAALPTQNLNFPSTEAEIDPDLLDEEGGELAEVDLAALLGSVPPPDPDRNAAQALEESAWLPEISIALPQMAEAQAAEAVAEDAWQPEPDVEEITPPETQGASPDAAQSETPSAQAVETQADIALPAEENPVEAPAIESPDGKPPAGEAPPVETPMAENASTQAAAAETIPGEAVLFPWEEPEAPVEEPFPWEQVAAQPAQDPFLLWEQSAAADQTQPIPAPQKQPAQPKEERPRAPDLDVTIPVQARPTNLLNLSEPPPNPLEDTQPRVLTHLTSIRQLEPVSPSFSQIIYTCVLIPRLPQHHLTGMVSEKLGQWVPQFCLAFGWRLEGIAVRPEYLQTALQVSPSIAPANLVRILRARSSESIFEAFPQLSRQNPSGDFWAPGYLIVAGAQPPSPRLLRDYIAETRRRQGAAFPAGELPAPGALPTH